MERRAYALEMAGLRERPDPRSNSAPQQDPAASGWLHVTSLGREPRILFGRVVDTVAYAHFYKVKPERGGAPFACTDTLAGSTQLVGATPLASYPVGCGVLVLCHPQLTIGLILCAVPDFGFDGTSGLADAIVQGSNVGLHSDKVHSFPMSLAGGGGVQDRSAGRPFDGLSGEWGAMTRTGLGVFLDDFMAFVRVDEETGLFVTYHDQLTRLTGHNLQLWSAGCQREDLDDENEWQSVEGWTPYLWEARGTFSPATGAAASRSYTAADAQVGQPWYGAVEPAQDDQFPFHRRRIYRGYLGQGGAELLAGPLQGASAGSLHRLSSPQAVPGLFEQAVGLDGGMGVRSAKGIFLSKRPVLAVPESRRTADDPTGDRSATYKAAGQYGSGPAHVPHDVAAPSTANPHLCRAATVMDAYHHLFNWKTFRHAFHYHSLDWYVPQESAVPSAGQMAAGVPAYGTLASNSYLPTPTPFTLKVDERYGNVLYFPNNSMLALLEDGGILLVDGWGSEIAMTGGGIRRSCAGDLWDLPGKNLNVWAGKDVILRANGSADVSANRGNVRIKAQQNVLGLAGLGGCGGFLWESRAVRAGYQYDANEPAVSGFVVRCKNSPVALMGQDMLLSTRHPSQGNHLVIDAGSAKVLVHGSSVEARGDNVVTLIANGKVHEFWSSEVNLSADLSVAGKLVATGCGMFGTSVATPSLAAALYLYDSVASSAVTAATTAVTSRQTTLATYATDSAADVTDLVTRAPALLTVQFVWRSATGHLTTGLQLYRSRWQQIASLSSQVLPAWTENGSTDEVSSQTYPHPGKEAWASGVAFCSVSLNLHDDVSGLAVDRGVAYETLALATPTTANLDGNYPVIVNP